MSEQMIIVAILLVAAFLLLAVFIWLLYDKIKDVEKITNGWSDSLQNMDGLQFKRIRLLETELRVLERHFGLQYIEPHRRRGKMAKLKESRDE